MQPVVVLGKAAIAGLAITEDLLDVPEGCSTLARTLALIYFGFQFFGIQLLPGTRSFGNESGDVFAVLMLIPLLNAKVPGIAENSLLFTMQQLVGGHDVVNVGSGTINAMNQAQRVIDTRVHLHTEVPFVALSGLVHFRRSADAIALAGTVLGGVGSSDSGGIYNTAFALYQAIFLQVSVYLFKQPLPRPCCSMKYRKLRMEVSSGKRSSFMPTKCRMAENG